MVEDFGLRVDDYLDGVVAALEIGDEDFYLAAGRLPADLVDDHGKGARAAEDIVVTVHAGDDGMLEAEGGDGFGNATGFIVIDGVRTALGHGAEAAAARADVAQHHESGGLVVPALADVGAMGALADGMEVEVAGELFEGVEIVAGGSLGFEPVRLGRGMARRRADLNEIEGGGRKARICDDGIGHVGTWRYCSEAAQRQPGRLRNPIPPAPNVRSW